MNRYVVDASVAIKWFIPETHSDLATRLQRMTHGLHVPAFFMLELGNVLSKKIRRAELTSEEGEIILKEVPQVPLQHHADARLFRPAYALALQTQRSLYDCLYLALAEVIDGALITADRQFYMALASGIHARRMLWIEDLPEQ